MIMAEGTIEVCFDLLTLQVCVLTWGGKNILSCSFFYVCAAATECVTPSCSPQRSYQGQCIKSGSPFSLKIVTVFCFC